LQQAPGETERSCSDSPMQQSKIAIFGDVAKLRLYVEFFALFGCDICQPVHWRFNRKAGRVLGIKESSSTNSALVAAVSAK